LILYSLLNKAKETIMNSNNKDLARQLVDELMNKEIQPSLEDITPIAKAMKITDPNEFLGLYDSIKRDWIESEHRKLSLALSHSKKLISSCLSELESTAMSGISHREISLYLGSSQEKLNEILRKYDPKVLESFVKSHPKPKYRQKINPVYKEKTGQDLPQ